MKKIILKTNQNNPEIKAYKKAVEKGRQNHHVVYKDDSWKIIRGGSEKAVDTFETQQEAINKAKSIEPKGVTIPLPETKNGTTSLEQEALFIRKHREFVMKGFRPPVGGSTEKLVLQVLMANAEEDVKVSVSDGILTVKGEKTTSKQDQDKNYLMREINYGCYERNIPLPDSADLSKVQASFKKGMLWVNIPKKAEAIKERREIKVEKAK